MSEKENLLKSLSTRNRLIIILVIIILAGSVYFISSLSSDNNSQSTNKDIAGIATQSTNLKINTANNTSTTDDSILIEGTVNTSTTKVVINDTEVQLKSKDEKKYFSQRMSLEIGDNSFVIKAFDINNQEDKKYTLTATRKKLITCEVLAITDGDTIKILYKENEEKVRLIGINTPETNECFNQEATNKMKSLVEDKNVRIEFDKTQRERDKYNRLLLYIWEGDNFINDIMIREGYAHEYTYNLPYKYQDQFKKAENEARENENGLWGGVCACQEGAEIDRICIFCNKAQITRTHWDCSTYTAEINDNSCTSGCYSTPSVPTTPTYICNCSKTCSEMSSCEEAYYQLSTCGCSRRDGDNDGVPCENICPGG